MFDAASWLDAWLAAYPWRTFDDNAGQALIRDALQLPRDARLALLKATVARLPMLRASAEEEPFAWQRGSAAYELACRLYGEKLPYGEADVVALLTSSTHECGHGSDVKPPFEVAVAWAREHGVTPAWLAAVRTFIDGLKGLRSVQSNDLKTKGGVVLLLDTEWSKRSRCYSERFRSDLGSLPTRERVAWERLVLHMGTSMGARMPKGYDAHASALVELLGTEDVIARLGRWLPRPDEPCRLETAGSHLVRNLVWLLLVMSRNRAVAASGDELVERVLRVEVVPAQLGKKIAVAGAVYFAQRPPGVGRRPLEALMARFRSMEKRSYDSDGIQKIYVDYLSRTA